MSQLQNIPTYYPYAIRRLIYLFETDQLPNIARIHVESEYGHIAAITYYNGQHRIMYGGDLGINAGAAAQLAKDKGYSKELLRHIGVMTPAGETFLMSAWAARVNANPAQQTNPNIGRTFDRAHSYIKASFDYPVYVKPIDGSQGIDIYRVVNEQELNRVFARYNEQAIRVALVEEPVAMPDYRILILDGRLISAYRRTPLTVTGNGQATVRQLLKALQSEHLAIGRDTRLNLDDERIAQTLSRIGLTLESVLPDGVPYVLLPVSNLSAGGTSEDVTYTINQRWVDLAAFVADNFNLRLCGLDLACSDITSASADYSVLEVNAAPGLNHYAATGEAQQRILDNLYVQVLNNP